MTHQGPELATPMQRLQDAMRRALALSPSFDVTQAAYRATAEWDSVAHMQLVSELEETFDIMLETADVLDLSSWSKALDILRKYDVAV